jgi:hypothetical protein
MKIGEAVDNLWLGVRVARKGWHGKDMSLAMQIPDAKSKMTEPYVYLNIGQKKIPWNCSQADLLADDWMIVG